MDEIRNRRDMAVLSICPVLALARYSQHLGYTTGERSSTSTYSIRVIVSISTSSVEAILNAVYKHLLASCHYLNNAKHTHYIT